MKTNITTNEAIPDLERASKLFFFTYVLFNFIGISIDSIDYYTNNLSFLLSLNIFNLFTISILITLLFLQKITIQTANPVFFYVLALNIIITDLYILNNQIAGWQLIIFRDAFVYMISIIVAGIINGKKHVIVLTLMYMVFLTYALIVSERSYFTANIIIVALCVCVFSVSIVFYISKLSKTLLDKSELQKAIFEKDIELLNKKNEMELQKTLCLEESIAHKNRELTAYAMILVQNEEFQKKIKMEIFEIQNSDKKHIDSKLANLISDLAVFNQHNHWDEFHKRFEDVHQDFYKTLNLNHSNLSPADLKLAALIKLGLSAKEIAAITQNTHESVHVARSRLRKKLKLETVDNLTIYFNNFY